MISASACLVPSTQRPVSGVPGEQYDRHYRTGETQAAAEPGDPDAFVAHYLPWLVIAAFLTALRLGEVAVEIELQHDVQGMLRSLTRR